MPQAICSTKIGNFRNQSRISIKQKNTLKQRNIMRIVKDENTNVDIDTTNNNDNISSDNARSEMSSSPPLSLASSGKATNSKSVKSRRRSIACKVCKRPSFYSYYSVRCCEGCKQFFRRIVVGQKEYWCKHDRMCSIKNGDHCLACRLDRCLLAGMQPHLVNVTPMDEKRQEFVKGLEQRREEIQNYRNELRRQYALGGTIGEGLEWDDDWNGLACTTGGYVIGRERALVNLRDWQQLDMLLMVEQRQKRIWDVAIEVPPGLEQFQTTEELLHFPGHIFTPPKQLRYNRAIKPETGYTSAKEAMNFVCIDVLLLFEWVRAMPVFTELDTRDQLALVRQIHYPFAALCNAFYASAMNAGTWTRGNNIVFHNSPLALNDERYRMLSEKVFCQSVDLLRRHQISQEEFVLLLAILCCTSNGSALSAACRERLYTQSTEYCRILMQFQQQRHGPEGGAHKYADCMHVLEEIIRLKHTSEMLAAYRAMLVSMKPEFQRDPLLALPQMPKSLEPFNVFVQ